MEAMDPQDRKDLDKFIRFFALKCVQVIVQSRLGYKICTPSDSSPVVSDWFYLAIKDIPEVTHEAKKALCGQLPSVGRSMCVEISLKTSEGDSMELEVWCLGMNEKSEPDVKVSYTVYNRLSFLLKSLVAVTRVTPAYRLSRRQGHEYVILYRIYFGDVQLLGLKEGFQTIRVGSVGTPGGTVTLTCAYRTNLAFISTRAPDDQGNAYLAGEDSQDIVTASFSTSPPSQMVNTTKDGGLPVASTQPTQNNQGENDRQVPTPASNVMSGTSSSEELDIPSSSSPAGKSTSPNKRGRILFSRKVGAFVDKPSPQITYESLDIPFAAFAPRSDYDSDNDPMVLCHTPSQNVVCPESPVEVSPDTKSLQSSTASSETAQDDFVMVDWRPAFTKDDIGIDVGTFFREFQNPPQLSSLSVDGGARSMADDLSIPEKLAMHERNMKEFDAFVDSLQ